MKEKTLWLVQTAMLLALCIAFQSLRLLIGDQIISVIIIGSLVNLVLYVSVKSGGIYSGLAVSILSPIIAFLQGHIAFPQMILVVALGNATLVLVYWLITKKEGVTFNIIGIVTASLAKFLVLFLAVSKFIIPILTNITEIQNKATAAKKPLAAIVTATTNALNLNFTWPQIVTALIGGALSIAVVIALRKAKLVK